jgi:hypothetical protein
MSTERRRAARRLPIIVFAWCALLLRVCDLSVANIRLANQGDTLLVLASETFPEKWRDHNGFFLVNGVRSTADRSIAVSCTRIDGCVA